MPRGTLANQNWQCFTPLFPSVGRGGGEGRKENGETEKAGDHPCLTNVFVLRTNSMYIAHT